MQGAERLYRDMVLLARTKKPAIVMLSEAKHLLWIAILSARILMDCRPEGAFLLWIVILSARLLRAKDLLL